MATLSTEGEKLKGDLSAASTEGTKVKDILKGMNDAYGNITSLHLE